MSSIETRNVERDSMFLMADIVTDPGQPPLRVKVRNLSAGGMMAVGEMRMTSGQKVVVELRNIGPVAGVVAWVRGERFGVSFDEEIDPKLARQQVGGGMKEAPVYAHAAVSAPRHDGWHGKVRRI